MKLVTPEQQNLYSQDRNILIPDGELEYAPDYFSVTESDFFLQDLLQHINWTTRTLKLYGREQTMPRLLAWYADPGIEYAYSGGMSPHNHWTEALQLIKQRLEQDTQKPFNGVLVNLYRDGRDSMSWHSDAEASLGKQPFIAALSFGETRLFELKHKYKRHQQKIRLPLTHGSLLIMKGDLQQNWLHQVPKDKAVTQARINLTFRFIYSSAKELTVPNNFARET